MKMGDYERAIALFATRSSDYELISNPNSARSTCSSSSSIAGCSGPSSEAAVQVTLDKACTGSTALSGSQQTIFGAQPQQQRMMTSITPKLSMRPINTPVNLLVCGASGCGKSSFIRAFVNMLSPEAAATSVESAEENEDSAAAESWRVSGIGLSVDPHAVLGPAVEFAAVVGPLSAPEAGRELLYKLQDCPAYGATLDLAGYLEALLRFIFQQQQKDFEQLHGSSCKGRPKSLVGGSLAHSVTACLYFLPPHGPSKLDLLLMAGLARHVALLPVVGKADCMSGAEAEECCRLVAHMLEQPGEYVAGLEAVELYRPSASELPFLVHTRSHGAAANDDVNVNTNDKGQAGLMNLLALLTGDEVYCLLDHAWHNYTTFCTANKGAGGSIAVLVSEACAAARQTWLPSCAASAQVNRPLEQQQEEEDSENRTEPCTARHGMQSFERRRTTHPVENIPGLLWVCWNVWSVMMGRVAVS